MGAEIVMKVSIGVMGKLRMRLKNIASAFKGYLYVRHHANGQILTG